MKHISILVLNEAILGSIEGTHKLLTAVNDIAESMGNDPVFKVELVGANSSTVLNKGLFSVFPEKMIHDIDHTDLIFIPAMHGDMQESVSMNREFIPWVVEQYNKGAEIASLCVGAFLLAETGLVDGKRCATHWLYANEFRKTYPRIDLVDEKIITDEQGIYSSGGAYSFLNLVLYIIEKYAGREIAILCSKTFQIEFDRGSQSQFIMFRGQKGHDDESIIRAQEYIEKNYQEKITVDQLATMLAIGRRNLERRFKKATSNTILEYIQRVKIEAAKMSLETSRDNVNEVMYMVGYSDTKAFRSVFKKTTGLSPIEYRNKYNRDLQVSIKA
ncbi:AraC family transcriptional regulator [Chitinophaga caeni]|uniref:AraC family transcriptional regulator n=1 Tax=Chitinophaga caeni TaxID=2029983 RepID=A0A291QVZ5_9BACT|nr:helix-turn-helix domain-containing protein [Chitinophaga caeni]ATL48023.1 AraC family transcriptional regulator [Chitinophaga caeni]